uniref:THAP-type domain-containing protein n=1 Tax=Sphaeramia orbicularis TaxID=375764 RepID=A0A672Z682_9TELE
MTMAERQHSCTLCSNRTSTMHMLPKNPEFQIKWLQFIFGTMPQHYNSKLTFCSSHFEESDFFNFGEFSRGFTIKLLLKPGAVPLRQSTTSAHLYNVYYYGRRQESQV